MTRNEAIGFFSRFYAIWPQADLPDATVDYWIEMLRRSSVEGAIAALRIVEGESKFFPSVAEWQSATRRAQEHMRVMSVDRVLTTDTSNLVGPKKVAALMRELADKLRMDRGAPASHRSGPA